MILPNNYLKINIKNEKIEYLTLQRLVIQNFKPFMHLYAPLSINYYCIYQCVINLYRISQSLRISFLYKDNFPRVNMNKYNY